MKPISLIFLFLFLLSCNSKREAALYTVSDIAFPEDNFRRIIERNKICRSDFYVVSGKPLYPENIGDVRGKCIKSLVYDKQGNMIQDANGVYKFNESNLVTFSNAGLCFSSKRHHNYLVNSKDRILYRMMTEEEANGTKRKIKDTIFYYFNTEGKVTSSTYGRNGSQRENYFYDSKGRIVLISAPYRNKKFFYSEDVVDSVYYDNICEGEHYIDKYYYDEKGLLYKAAEYTDNLKIMPCNERPLITYDVRNIKCN